MVKSLSKVVYKPDSQSTDEFIMIVNGPEYKKWKEGDTTIPLVEVVESFEVFISSQGSQGILGQASKQQLENTFGTSKDIDVAEQLLKQGSLKSGDDFSDDHILKNIAKGGYSMDLKGSGGSLSGARH